MTIYFSESAIIGIDADTLQQLRDDVTTNELTFREYFITRGFYISEEWPNPNREKMTPEELSRRIKALMADGVSLEEIVKALSPVSDNEPEPDPAVIQGVLSITPEEVQETGRSYITAAWAARGARRKVA